MGRTVMVSSVPCEDGLGVVLALKSEAWLVTHALLPSAPNGVGDLLAALMAQACLTGIAPHHALSQAVGGVYEAIEACETGTQGDLPIVAMGKRLTQGSDQVSLILLD
jgi:pyridoxal/pyridoxine/pyridoxamine kinase